MFDLLPSNSRDATLSALHVFVQDHQDALINAASLLSGNKGRKVIANLAAALEHAARRGPAAEKAAWELLGILSLERVHEVDSVEAERFACIDPADPRVEEICLLTDQLREALEAGPDHPPASRHRSVA